jgi:hypothetical protein
MEMDKQKRLVDQLLDKSRQGRLDWQETPSDESFAVSFSGNSIAIEPLQRRAGYLIRIINSSGTVVDQFHDETLDETEEAPNPPFRSNKWFAKMRDLYDLARRTALGSEEILDEILGELDAVGRR